MQLVTLGRKGPRVSTVGFGAWAIGGLNWGPTNDAVSRRALLEAFELGVNLVDTADVYGYGHSEELVADAVSEFGKSRILIATKVGNDFYNATEQDETGYGRIRLNGNRDYIIWAAEQSLRRLRVEAIDILQLHSLETEQLESEEPWDALARLKEQGKIRFAGWSVKSYKETEQAHLLDHFSDVIDCIQVRYNLLERDAEAVLLPKALDRGIGVIVRIPLLFGLLTGKFSGESRFDNDDHRSFNLPPAKLATCLRQLERYEELYRSHPDQTRAQVSLRFCISHPACHTVIPGAKSPEQVQENCAASDLGTLELPVGLGDDGQQPSFD